MSVNMFERTLGEICDEVGGIIKTGPFGSQLHQSDYRDVGTPVVMPKDIIGDKLSENSISRIGEEDVERLSQHKLNEGDIVYGRRGDIGRQALITQKEKGWLCGTGCLRIGLGASIIDPLFLHYYLKQSEVVGWICNQAIGATMPNLNTQILRSVPVKYPPIKIQQKIASILSTYDGLIENNTRRIQILEEMAQTLYREWFVNFHFPGHEKVKMVDSPLGKIPEGWGVKPLGEAYKTGSGGTPSRKKVEYYGGENPWIKTRELKDGFVLDADEKITVLGLKKSSAKLFPEGTVIIAMYGATIGKLGILTQKSATNQACCALLPLEEPYGSSYIYWYLLNNRQELISLGQGAAQQNISQIVIKKFEMLVPEPSIVEYFNQTADVILRKIKNLALKNQNLRQTRDLLLPKLISGAIDVSDLEIQVKETAA